MATTVLISAKHCATHGRHLLTYGILAALLPCLGLRAQAPSEGEILTNMFQIWGLPRETRDNPHRIRFEAVIYYFDAEWNVVWGECDGRPTVLPIGNAPLQARQGDRILIDGLVIPSQQNFIWDKTRVQVIQHDVPLKPQAIPNLTDQPVAWNKTLVTVEGLIDRDMAEESPGHLAFRFQCGDSAAIAYVLREPNAHQTWKAGDYVRIKGVYFSELDREGKPSRLNLYIARPEDIEVIGSLATDARFSAPVTDIDQIQEDISTNTLIRVRGVVRHFEPGKWVTIWDETGQLMVQTPQMRFLQPGDHVEAIGYPYVNGIQECLRAGLYRLAADQFTPATDSETGAPLRLAARIQELSRTEAARHQPVNLHGVVTWSHPSTPFIYVLDPSGGVRVLNPKWQGHDAQRPGSIVSVRGEVAEGDFVPVVTNAVVTRSSYWNIAAGPLVNLEQALTGAEEGHWIQMRGLVRSVTHTKFLTRLEMGTSSGGFAVWTPTPTNHLLEPEPGSIIRVEGVCGVVANERHQLTSVEIWAVKGDNFQVEEPAPKNVFAAPMRALGDLRRFSLESDLNRRVRTAGTVVLREPGQYIYVEDGADSVLALCQQTDPLQLGDRVEVVGFPGRQGRKFVLRDAIYRRTNTGPEPAAIALPAAALNPDLQGLLVKSQGTLLNIEHTEGEWRLLLDPVITPPFKVILRQETGDTLDALQLGSRLAVCGVYEVQYDEIGTPHSFQLRLRSPADVVVARLPAWWTLGKALGVLAVVLGAFIVGVVWAVAIQRKNNALALANTKLRDAQTELQTAHDHLEVRVQERTSELEQQVAAKERARAELAEAQRNLIVISRQAGMAEVATGILHNVGNVLNSVNVSATLLRDRLRQHRAEVVSKVALLLQQTPEDLARYLVQDPKGKTVPDFLTRLGHSLVEDKRNMEGEVNALTKNVEHINVIVSMQQNYARAGGVLEDLNLKEVVEDAIQINASSLERHGVRLQRDFQPIPSTLVDRHKILQILINLITNAKDAVETRKDGKEMVISICSTPAGRIQIRVTDNGSGIAPENLERIFSQGFTTRQDGHGFGLHSGALAAKELGGSLAAQSEGIGRGATFTLDLPLSTPPAHRAEIVTQCAA